MKRKRHRSASGKFAKKKVTRRHRRAREAAPVATEAKRRRRHKSREAPVATEAKRRKRRRHKARETAPVATEAKRRKRRRHKAREAAPVATEARRRKRHRRAREAPVATESRRRHKRRRVTGQVMEAKRRGKRRGKRTHARKGTKAARRAAAKKGWAKRRRERKKFVGPMRRGYTRAAEARRKPRRRHRRAREVAEVSESRRGRGRRHHRKSRMFEARGGKRGAYVAELALAIGTGSLAYILANGLDRFLATYNPNGDPAKAPKHKFTSDGAGTLANALNLADHPSWIRIGAGVGMAAAPAVASAFVKHPLLRSSLEGAAVGASVQLVQMLWSNVLVPLFAPKSADQLKTSFIARLYPSEVAAHLNRSSSTTAFTGGTAPGLSGAPADAPAPGTVGQPSGDVGPFALQGPSSYPSAVEALRAYAAGVQGGHEANRLETGIGGYYYPSVQEIWRQATGGDTHRGYPSVQDILTRTTTAVAGLTPAVQAAMPGITPAQADQVAVTTLAQPNDIPGALQQIFPDMPEQHRHEFGRRLHQHVHHHHRRMRGGEGGGFSGIPGAPPPPGEMFGGLVEEARRRFPHMRHEHHMQIAGHILTEPHNIPGALRRALPNEPEHVLHEHAKHLHKHVKHVAEAVAPGAAPPPDAIPAAMPHPDAVPVPLPDHAPDITAAPAPEHAHLAGVGDTGLGYIARGISSFGRGFSPVQTQQFAAHAYSQPWNLPGVIQHWMPGMNQQQYGQYGQQLHPHVWQQYQQQYGQQYGQQATGGGLFAIVQQILPEVPSTQLQSLIAQLQAAPYNIIAALKQVLPNLPERSLHERARRLHPYFSGSTVTPPAPPVAGVSQPPPLPPPGPTGIPDVPGPNGKPAGESCGCGQNDMFLGLAGEGEAVDSGADRLIIG